MLASQVYTCRDIAKYMFYWGLYCRTTMENVYFSPIFSTPTSTTNTSPFLSLAALEGDRGIKVADVQRVLHHDKNAHDHLLFSIIGVTWQPRSDRGASTRLVSDANRGDGGPNHLMGTGGSSSQEEAGGCRHVDMEC